MRPLESYIADQGPKPLAEGRAVVSTGNPIVTETAIRIMESGGNAADAAITAALVQGLVDGVLVVPYTETLLGALVGLAWGRAHRGRECLPVEAGGRMIVTLMLCLSASVLAVGTWIQAEQLAERISRQEGQSGVLLPRFWSAGWIDTHAHQ